MINFQIHSEKDKGEHCWGWRIIMDGKLIATCTEYKSKDENRDDIKRMTSGKCSLQDIKGLNIKIIVDNIDIEKLAKLIIDASVEYECKEDDPAHSSKTKDKTTPKGIPGSGVNHGRI